MGRGTKAPEASASVVIPTYGRPAALLRCLEAVEQQSIRDSLEVIVSCDGPDAPSLPERIATVTAPTRRGPAAARNAGVRRATAPLVLFTDDDCVPDPAWAERLVEALRAGEEVVAGTTMSTNSRFARASQVIVDALMRRQADGTVTFAPTMNLGVRRELLLALPFDESFGDAAGEDRAWCLRVRERGAAIAVREDARLDHRPELTFRGFLHQHVRYGRGSLRFRSRYRTGLARPSFYRELVRDGFRSGPVVGLLVVLSQLATAAGVVRERLA
jgi:cellulose synthase/poly-beta-1,6-N-acetylglucosamine synthase-like glycosyltransferase